LDREFEDEWIVRAFVGFRRVVRGYDTDFEPNVFDLRVTLRFIQTRRDGTENVERAIASSFWRVAATLVARKRLKRVGSTKQLRFVKKI
jgi:hypothetical protein